MAHAFSYVRFSSKRQIRGDSSRRQLNLARKYAADHDLTLDDRSFQDLGVSAFKGRNLKEGSLGLFLEAVENKLAPEFENCFLLVESLDRISRQSTMTALETFQRIVRNGVTLVTIADGFSYSTKSLDADWTKLIVALSHMSRAHNENSLKSQRGLANLANARTKALESLNSETRFVMKSILPSWLTRKADGTGFIVDLKITKVIKKVFDLAEEGNGTVRIAKYLIAKKLPLVTTRKPRQMVDSEGEPIKYDRERVETWTAGKVQHLLNNQAVRGVYAPPASGIVWAGYFPHVISDEQFFKVQEAMKARTHMRAHDGSKLHYLFTGLGECALCNGRMKMVSMNTRGRGITSYLRCRNALEDKTACDAGIFPYRPAEAAILRFLADDLSVTMATINDAPEARSVGVLRAQHDDLEGRLGELIEMAAGSRNPKSFASKIDTMQRELESLAAQMLDARPADFNRVAMQKAAELFETFKGFSGPMDLPTRQCAQDELRRMLQAVYFMPATDDHLPAVALQYVESLGHGTRHITITPDKPGVPRGTKMPRKKIT